MKTTQPIRLSASPLVAALILVLGAGPAYAAAAAAEPPAIPVVTAELQTVPDLLPFTGRVEAAQRVELRPRVSGPVTAIHYTEGAAVAAGASLFTIDPRPYRARRDRQAAALAQAEAEAMLARQELGRARELHAATAVSAEELERRTAAAAATAAAEHAARAALAAAELDLEFTEVRAPIAGRAGRILHTVGNLAVADVTVVTVIVADDAMRVRFAVDETTFQRLRAVREQPVKAYVTVAGVSDRIPATVDYVGNRIDPASGTAEVRASVDGAAAHLADGMFARLHLALPAAGAGVLVPETALGAEQGSRYVLIAGEDGKITQRRVTLGQRVGDLRSVVSGLSPGETVVVAGLQFLRPGMTIRPLRPAAPAPAQAAPAQD